jgi:chromosome segregation ATPase
LEVSWKLFNTKKLKSSITILKQNKTNECLQLAEETRRLEAEIQQLETDVMVAGEDLSALTTTCEPHEKEYAGIAAELHEAKQELQALQEALSAYNVYKQHRH